MKHLIRIWGNIGDAVCAEPFVREFVKRHPNEPITVQSMAPTLYQRYPGVTAAVHLDDAINRKLFNKYWFAHPDWQRHISGYFDKYKFNVTGQAPRLNLPPADLSEFEINFDRPVVCLAAAPSNAIRQWPIEHWEHLTSRLNQHRVVTVQLGCGEPPIPSARHCWVNKTTLLQSAEILKRSRLLVTIDSGLSHLAAAVGTKAVTLFGPVDPAIREHRGLTIPVTAGQCTACWPTYRGIKHCPKGHHNCMDITVQAVLAAALKNLK